MKISAAVLSNLLFGMFILAISFVSYVAGAAVIQYKLTSSGFLTDAFEAGSAWYAKKTRAPDQDEDFPDVISEDIGRSSGYKTSKAYNGYTLYSTIGGKSAKLVNMEGKQVYEWMMPFDKAWPTPSHIPYPVKSEDVYMHDSLIFPNGDLIANYHAMRDTPYGYGLVKIDKNTNILWRYNAAVHHDFIIGEDNNIYTITHEINKRGAFPKLPFLHYPTLADYIVTLSPEGKELQKIRLVDAFFDTPYEQLLFSESAAKNPKGDFTHANSVSVLNVSIADKFPLFEAGDILVSIRNLHTLAVLRPSTGKIIWAMQGPWRLQHYAKLLDNGHIILFDNFGYYNGKKRSRVMEIDPVTQAIVWSYSGDKKHDFRSGWRGAGIRLPNGNTLIIDVQSSGLLEITPSKEVVWEYQTKTTFGKKGNMILNAMRYAPEQVPFLQEQDAGDAP